MSESTAQDTPIQILTVDDEENILKSLRRLLTHEDYDVLTATSGEEGLKIIKENPAIALIISDQRMPGLTGAEFLEQTRKIAPDVTRIILTGYADITAAIDGINKGGAYRYITKPWDDKELVKVVNDAVLKHTLIKENERLTGIVKEQNEELQKWNSQLEYFVQEQTLEIQKNNETLKKLNKDLTTNFRNTILAFSGLIELRDKKSGSHSKNVAKLSVKIATHLGMPEKDIQDIFYAGLLHDIGKIGIPDILVAKDPADMKADEKEIYERHPVRGQMIVDSIEGLRKAGTIIRHHHEWYNGNGFPDGLSGEKISLGARIISVADYIDRTIRKFTGDTAIDFTLKKLEEQLGKQFAREIFGVAELSAKEFFRRDSAKTSLVELELPPKYLEPGMVISRDLKSGTGILILSKGIELDRKNINALRRSHQLDPVKSSIFVLVKR